MKSEEEKEIKLGPEETRNQLPRVLSQWNHRICVISSIMSVVIRVKCYLPGKIIGNSAKVFIGV